MTRPDWLLRTAMRSGSWHVLAGPGNQVVPAWLPHQPLSGQPITTKARGAQIVLPALGMEDGLPLWIVPLFIIWPLLIWFLAHHRSMLTDLFRRRRSHTL